jgi:hypothetical protein
MLVIVANCLVVISKCLEIPTSVEMKRQMFMQFVTDREAFYAGMVHTFESGTSKALCLIPSAEKAIRLTLF